MRNVRIIGTGSYLPKKVVTNYDLEQRLDTSHDWIVQRTGIHQRHEACDEETVSYMSSKSAEMALEKAGISPDKVGLIIVATCTGESVFPSSAGKVQKALNIPECPAFDLSAACAGFTYALAFANSYIKTNQCEYALVIGSEIMCNVVNKDDRSIAVLFGDGSGAVVLGPSEREGIIATELHADANYGDLLCLDSFYPRFKDETDLSRFHVHMDGRDVFKVAVEKLGNMVENILHNNGYKKSDLDWLVPHQANYRIIKAVAKRLDLPEEQVILTVHNHANTSAASIPLALDYGVSIGKIKAGDLLLLESFGGGLAWGSALVRY